MGHDNNLGPDAVWWVVEEQITELGASLAHAENTVSRTYHVVGSNEGPEGVSLWIMGRATQIANERRVSLGLCKPEHKDTREGLRDSCAEFHSYGSDVPTRVFFYMRAHANTEAEARRLLDEALSRLQTALNSPKA